VALGLGVLLLDESFTVGIAVGFPLVLLGCYLSTRKSKALAPLPAVAEA
jgi:drug/metabolite transporter (DMT)-like permease